MHWHLKGSRVSNLDVTLTDYHKMTRRLVISITLEHNKGLEFCEVRQAGTSALSNA